MCVCCCYSEDSEISVSSNGAWWKLHLNCDVATYTSLFAHLVLGYICLHYPKLDDSEVLDAEGVQKYQSLIRLLISKLPSGYYFHS